MRKFLTSFTIFVTAFLIFSVTTVSAKVITDKTGTVTVAKTEVVNDDLFIGAQNAVIDGVVNGDVFVGAQTVKVTGIVNGNLHVAANTIDLSGTVKGNVYAVGQSILVIGSKIGGSLIVGGATANVDKDSAIGGAVLAGVGNLTIDSQVKRSVYAGTGNLTIGSDAKIGKDLYYASGKNQANIATGAKITGSTYKTETKTASSSANMAAVKKQLPAIMNIFTFGASLISFLSALVVGFIFIKMFGKHFTNAINFASNSFWKSFGVGFLIAVAFVPALIILILTVIGIPIAGLAILVFLIFSYFAKIVVGAALGAWISKKFNWKMPTYGAFVLGLFLIYVLKMIPVVGFLTGLVVFWVGVGALTLHAVSETK